MRHRDREAILPTPRRTKSCAVKPEVHDRRPPVAARPRSCRSRRTRTRRRGRSGCGSISRSVAPVGLGRPRAAASSGCRRRSTPRCPRASAPGGSRDASRHGREARRRRGGSVRLVDHDARDRDAQEVMPEPVPPGVPPSVDRSTADGRSSCRPRARPRRFRRTRRRRWTGRSERPVDRGLMVLAGTQVPPRR